MDAVRHTGIGFSQAEILRAYSIQLHLKQIARILRASRVETWGAVGNLDKIDRTVPEAEIEKAETPSDLK